MASMKDCDSFGLGSIPSLPPFRLRLMAGFQTLNLKIVVRVHAPEPKIV